MSETKRQDFHCRHWDDSESMLIKKVRKKHIEWSIKNIKCNHPNNLDCVDNVRYCPYCGGLL